MGISGTKPAEPNTEGDETMCYYEYYWDGFNYFYQWVCF